MGANAGDTTGLRFTIGTSGSAWSSAWMPAAADWPTIP